MVVIAQTSSDITALVLFYGFALMSAVSALAAVMLVARLMAVNNAKGNFGSAEQPAGTRYPVDQLGQALLGDYLVPFELASVLLLVVMIGAAYLAKGRRREDEGAEMTR